jgi:DNA-binding Lrp family transcriptional regulator
VRRGDDDVVLLDDLDTTLVALLASDPRMSNVSLAKRAGVTDETVAARLRKLLQSGALAMTALVDWERAGYAAHGIVRVRTAHGSPADAVGPLVEAGSTHLVAVTTGACEVVIGLLARDVRALREQFIRSVRMLESVVSASMSIVTEACRHDLHATTLPLQGWSSGLLKGSTVALDELDVRLIELLIARAHESNRWLARRLEVSDGTVRARLQRLEEVGLLRIAAVSDTVTVGEVRSAAFVFIDMAGDDADAVANLLASPNIGTLDRCVGDASLVALATAASENELYAYLSNEVRRLKNVAGVEVATVIEALQHRANLVRLLPPPGD